MNEDVVLETHGLSIECKILWLQIHFNQYEKLIVYGVIHVAAIDGHTHRQ